MKQWLEAVRKWVKEFTLLFLGLAGMTVAAGKLWRAILDLLSQGRP